MSARDPSLDGLRGIAITMVVAYHYLTPLLPETTLTSVFSAMAASGVDLFFVLSGYLLGGILLDHRHSPHYFRAFYARRIWRTLPLYTVLVVAGAGVAMTGYDRLNPVLQETLPWWSYVTMTQNITRATYPGYGSVFTAPTWSLAIEEQFYLVLPLMLRSMTGRWVPMLAVVALVTAPLLRMVSATSHVADPYAAAYAWPQGRVDVVCIGVLAAWLVRHRQSACFGSWLSAVACAAAILAATVVFTDPPLAIYVALFYSALVFCYGAVVLRLATSRGSIVSRLCLVRSLRWTGIRAYGIYLFHIPVVHAIHWIAFGLPLLSGHGLRSASASALSLMVTLALAHVSWAWFESPLVRWSRRRWTYDAPGRALET